MRRYSVAQTKIGAMMIQVCELAYSPTELLPDSVRTDAMRREKPSVLRTVAMNSGIVYLCFCATDLAIKGL